jgi:CheY-like chemotaxis protein
MNLSANALHALQGSMNGEFRIELDEVIIDTEFARKTPPLKPGAHIRITVNDTGHGMDPATKERIFDPFFTTKLAGEGTGLGLSTSLGIVRNHGGAIVVASEKGKGTRFTVYLPQVEEKAETWKEREEPSRNGFEHIFVVDDEEQMGRLMERLLKPLGYQITKKSNSQEALEVVMNAPFDFDLVLTDYTMPHLTGVQLAEALLRVHPDLPIILMSGYGEELDIEKIKSIGIKTVLDKTIPVNQFVSTIRQVLDGQ